MPRNRLPLFTILATLTAAGDATAGKVEWVTDLPMAQVRANEEQKQLFVLFTGHGWCGHCNDLEEEVVSMPEFGRSLAGDYTFVEFNLPVGDSTEVEEQAERVRTLAEKFLVRGYPTAVLMTADLVPYAYLRGYDSGEGAEAYVANVAAARRVGLEMGEATRQFAAEPNRDSLDRLGTALLGIAGNLPIDAHESRDPLFEYYRPLVDLLIRELPDSHDVRAALVKRIESQTVRQDRMAAWQPIEAKLNEFSQLERWDEAIRWIDDGLPEPSDPWLWFQVQQYRFFLLQRAGNYDAALEHVRFLRNHADVPSDLQRRMIERESHVLRKLGRLEDGVNLLDEAISQARSRSDDALVAQLLWDKLQIVLTTGQSDRIIPSARAVRETSDPETEHWRSASWFLAVHLRKLERFEEALEVAAKRYETSPDSFGALDVAAALAGLGRTEEAQQYLAAAELESQELLGSQRLIDRQSGQSLSDGLAYTRDEINKYAAARETEGDAP